MRNPLATALYNLLQATMLIFWCIAGFATVISLIELLSRTFFISCTWRKEIRSSPLPMYITEFLMAQAPWSIISRINLSRTRPAMVWQSNFTHFSYMVGNMICLVLDILQCHLTIWPKCNLAYLICQLVLRHSVYIHRWCGCLQLKPGNGNGPDWWMPRPSNKNWTSNSSTGINNSDRHTCHSLLRIHLRIDEEIRHTLYHQPGVILISELVVMVLQILQYFIVSSQTTTSAKLLRF